MNAILDRSKIVKNLIDEQWHSLAPSLDAIARAIETNAPEVWRKCYTKHIETPGNFRGWKAVAATFASGIVTCNIAIAEGSHPLHSNVGMIASLQEPYTTGPYTTSVHL